MRVFPCHQGPGALAIILLGALAVRVATADAEPPPLWRASLTNRIIRVPGTSPPIRSSKTAADCSGISAVANSDPACQETRYAYGGWCVNDEVARLFRLQDDPCLASCVTQTGDVWIEAAHVDMLVIGGNCPENQYPFTTMPFDAQFVLYTPDTAMSTPQCPVPEASAAKLSAVVSVPSRTVTGPNDPAGSFQVSFPLGVCVPMGSVFGAFKWIDMPPEALLTDCSQGGTATCAWLLPALLTLNGSNAQSECAACCGTYYRNVEFAGAGWSETCADLHLLGDFGFYLDATACLWSAP